MMSGTGLRTKALLGIIGIVVLLGLTVLIVARPALQEKLFKTLEKRGISIANHIAAASINPILTEQYFELKMMLEDSMASEDDIIYIFVLDHRGKVLAHTFEDGFPTELSNVNKVKATQKNSLQSITTEKGEVVDIAVPLVKGEAGFVHVGISGKRIKEDVNSIIKKIILLFIAVLIVGAALGIIMSRVITGRISDLTEAARAVSRGNLDQKVRVTSTDEIGQLGTAFNEMIQRRKEAEEERLKTQKLESIGILAGGIAHDFNNLLQGIFGYISMAKMSLDRKEKSLSMLEQAENALHRAVNLTTQLLTFSKGGKPVKKRISLLPVIEDAAKFALSGSRSYCQFDIEPGLWQVDADEGQLGQVIQNIVLNADQAMPDGGTVVITAKNVLKPYKELSALPKGKYVAISIQDSGIGIPEKYLQKIFDPYFTTKEKGSGLGLATSYSIVKNHGGLLDVTSEPGKGTTFRIYLPAIGVKKEFEEIHEVASGVRKGKILVMDDEDLVRNIAEELIKALGHEVVLVEHGEAAIEKYKAAMESGKPFDIVILDLTIRGGMGGMDTIERLRVIDPGVRAVVSSGYSDDTVVADYETYGFKARMTKPYKLDDLKDTLNKILSK